MPLHLSDDSKLRSPERDTVDEFLDDDRDPPSIVSISDVHGYLEPARSALTTLTDHPKFDPLVIADDDGTLHWADENYVLVFNGDLVDRGPDNEKVLELVARLVDEAPVGRVRITLGNHEAIMLSPDHFGFSNWYSGRVDPDDRRTFLEQILAGHVVAAYQGYNVTYTHAGSPDPYDVEAVNETLIDAAETLLEAWDTADDRAAQRRVLDEYHNVLGVGDEHPKGSGAGLVWLDFSYLSADSPAQVVGHTRHSTPRQKGNVYCQNVIRDNLDNDGGEAVFVETPQTLSALSRRPDGSVATSELDHFED